VAKNVIITTPAGRAIYPHLHAADTKFDKAGVYSTKLAQEPSEARDSLVKRLDDAFAESVAEAKKELNAKKPGSGNKIKLADKPWVEEMDSEGNETGNLVFNFKLKASGKTREGKEFTQAPKLYDSQGNPLPAGTKIGGGSTIKVAFEINKFYTAIAGAGVSLRLKAVQVIDLKTWEGGNAASFGFGVEEGGFVKDSFENETGETTGTETPETTDAPEVKDAKDSSDF
jgi:hypothetical protein